MDNPPSTPPRTSQSVRWAEDIVDPASELSSGNLNQDAADEAEVAAAIHPLHPSTPRASAEASIKAFSSTQDKGTPVKPTTHTVKDMKAEELYALICKELGEPVESDGHWASKLYQGMVPKSKITKYMKDSGEYDRKAERWVRIPSTVKSEDELYGPICDIANSVIKGLAPSGTAEVREAIDTHVARFKHEALGPTTRYSSPDVSIKAKGPSFSVPSGEPVGYSNTASIIDGKKDSEATRIQDHIGQLGGYSRQIFIQQPNRFFVRCLIVTEKQARLLHFDRSGVQYTPLFDFHKLPHVFVRLILGLCSTDERVLGFDDSVQWTIGADGTKVAGTLRTIGPTNTIVEYALMMDAKPFTRNSIRGRGTTCWPVRDANNRKLLVKDYWMSDGRIPEFTLLEKFENVQGICKMLCYEEQRAKTKDNRGKVHIFGAGIFRNRTAIRIVLELYGPTIENFTNPRQLVGALRDAIAGHRVLSTNGVFHRDICLENILLGFDDDGWRGVLIDLGMAIKTGRQISEICKDFKSGSPIFYSIMVLKGMTTKRNDSPAHDYLDDLEAFFWIYIFLVFMFKANGERIILKGDTDPEFTIQAWYDTSTAASSKFSFLGQASQVAEFVEAMDTSWPQPCKDLVVDFRKYMWHLFTEKEERLRSKKDPNANGDIPNRFSDVLSNVDNHYICILAFFDIALKKLEEEAVAEVAIAAISRPPWPPAVAESSTTGSGTANGFMAALPPPPPGPPPAQSPIHRTRSQTGKRTSRDILSEDEVSEPKRRRQQALPESG